VNGLISIAFCWLYRQPLVFLWTIPGTVLVGPALGHLSYAEVIGAFHRDGNPHARTRPLRLGAPRDGSGADAIVMGMVAGVFLRFGLDLVFAIRDDFWIAAPMVAAFVAISASQRLTRLVPPLIGALVVGRDHDTRDRQIRGRAAVRPRWCSRISTRRHFPGARWSSWSCRWRSPCSSCERAGDHGAARAGHIRP